jgi:hypothetical protein
VNVIPKQKKDKDDTNEIEVEKGDENVDEE